MTTEPLPDQSGTYEWRVVAAPAIITEITEEGQRRVAAPTADQADHRLAVVWTNAPVGALGELRYVSNFPRWGRLEFEPNGQVASDETQRAPCSEGHSNCETDHDADLYHDASRESQGGA